jgi:hypothetical protein
MRLEQDQSTHPRLLRKPALGEASADNPIKVEKRKKKPKGSRFVNPTQLDDDQKSRILTALTQKKIGDEMGRQIFIGAVEYQISAFSQQLQPPVAPEPEPPPRASSPAPDEALQTIAENAASLSRRIRALPDSAIERVTEMLAREAGPWRGYDGRFLFELSLEIERIERACIAAAGTPEPPPSGTEPEPESGPNRAVSRELVSKLAGAFSECFEMEPTAEENGPFQTTLEVLGEVTGLVIAHEPAFLAQVLNARTSTRNTG